MDSFKIKKSTSPIVSYINRGDQGYSYSQIRANPKFNSVKSSGSYVWDSHTIFWASESLGRSLALALAPGHTLHPFHNCHCPWWSSNSPDISNMLGSPLTEAALLAASTSPLLSLGALTLPHGQPSNCLHDHLQVCSFHVRSIALWGEILIPNSVASMECSFGSSGPQFVC